MPYSIPCGNTRCENRVREIGDLCENCKQEERKQEESRWMYAGFGKNRDNPRHERGKKEGKK